MLYTEREREREREREKLENICINIKISMYDEKIEFPISSIFIIITRTCRPHNIMYYNL